MKKVFSGPQVFLFILSNLGVGFVRGSISMYALRFFAPTEDTGLPLLLPVGAIGLIQGLCFIIDCLVDPIIASKCDNSKNPRGRRIPAMRLAAIPSAILAFLIFMVPGGPESPVNVVWVAVLFPFYCVITSIYDVNWMALIPELMTDINQRSKFLAIRAFAASVGMILLAAVSGVVPVLRDSGMDALSAWRLCIGFFPFLGAILMLLPVMLIRETDYVDPPRADQERPNLWLGIKRVLRFRTFMIYLVGLVLFNLVAGIGSSSIMYYVDVLFHLRGGMSTVFLGVMMAAQWGMYPLMLALSKKFFKRKVMIACAFICVAGFFMVIFHKPLAALLGTAPVAPGSFFEGLAGVGAQSGYVALVFVLGIFFAFPYGCGSVIGASIGVDFMHYDRIKTGQSHAGTYQAMINIVSMIPSTLLPMTVGSVIYLGSTNRMPTEAGVSATAVIALVLLAPTVFFYWLYNEHEILPVVLADKGGALEKQSEPA
jgi:GPH family glycoside/pentoside/hexuronide:cation symporter